MEAIIILLLLWFGGAILRALFSGASTVVRKVQGKPEPYFGPLQIKIEDKQDSELEFKEVFVRGNIRVPFPTKMSISLHFWDVSLDEDGDEVKMPLISHFEQHQEKQTVFFQKLVEGIDAKPDTSWTEWLPITPVFMDALQPPYKGVRKLRAFLALIPADDDSELLHGFFTESSTIYSAATTEFSYEFTETGYLEELNNRDDSMVLSVKIAMAVAMADGSLDDSEGTTISAWMKKNIESLPDSQHAEMKKRLNDAFKESYQLALEEALSLSDICAEISQKGTKKTKYDAIQLCLDVMAADGVADESELKVIHNIADAIGIDIEVLNRMKDEMMVDAQLHASGENAFSIIGIDDSMDKKTKLKIIRQEYQKWNNRLNSLETQEERDKAQEMLDLIADAKKKVEAE